MQDFVCALQDWSFCFPQSCGSPTTKSCWPSRSEDPGYSESLCGISRVGSLTWVQNLHNGGQISLVLLSFSLWVTHPVDMILDFIMIMSLLPYCCSYFFVVGHGISLFDGFQYPSVNGCSTASCNFDALVGGDEPKSYSAILNWRIH